MNFLDPLYIAALWSVSPVGELKLGMTYALAKGMPFWWSLWVCVCSNLLVVPLVFFGIKRGHPLLMRYDFYKKINYIFIKKGLRRFKKKQGSYLYWSLLLFVAIPLPGTGIYSASILASIFRLSFSKTFSIIASGAVCSALIVGLLMRIGQEILSL